MARIVAGKFDVGALLPTEQQLATEYGVNRSVVREAIKQLEVHQLVRPVKRRGTEVLDPLRSPSPDVLRAMLVPSSGVIDQQALAELLEIRARLDVELTCLAAERRTEADLAAMDQCLDELAKSVGDPERYGEAMEELLVVMARATRNRIYLMLVHWHNRVRADLPALQLMHRLANEPHLQGIRFLIELIRNREVEQARAFVTAVHEWLIPRTLASAALSSGAPLDAIMESIS